MMPHALLCSAAIGAALLLEGCPCLIDCDPDESHCTDQWRHDSEGGRECADDTQEPDDRFTLARKMPFAACKTETLEGVLSGDDVDFFYARGDRCADANPSLHLRTPGVRACLFAQCKTGSTALTRCVRGRPRHMANGLLGCCAEPHETSGGDDSVCLVPDAGVGEDPLMLSDSDAELETSCGNGQRKVNAYLVVDSATDACVEYAVDLQL